MSKMKLKLTWAAVLVAVAFGVVALRVAQATPSHGFFGTLVAGPVELDELNIKSNSKTHKVKIQTKGEWEARVMEFRIVPGGDTGLHSHPGPVFVMITAGTMTLYQADDPNNPEVYPAGTGFVEDPDRVHIARNEGTTDLELTAFFLTPAGEPIRTDEQP